MGSKVDITNLKSDTSSFDYTDSLPSLSSSSKPTLILSKGSSSNDKYDCDALGIHYELSTPQSMIRSTRLSTITKWDARLNRTVPVAEWERFMFKKDKIKMEALGANDFVLVNDVFPQTWGVEASATFNRTFLAPNGNKYTWQSRVPSMRLYRVEEGKEDTLVAAYHRGHLVINVRKPFIELFDGYEEILDLLVVTGTIAFSKRKDGEVQYTSGGS